MVKALVYKQHFSFTLFSLFLLLLIPGCWQQQEDLQKGLFVINVLDKQVYEDCHIKGSVNVPLQEIEAFAAKLDKDHAHIVVYCTNYRCTTSEFVCKQLIEKGFKHVWAYEGGMAEWYQLGFPVEGQCKNGYLTNNIEKPTLEQHTINVITAEELHYKMHQMQAHGGIAKW